MVHELHELARINGETANGWGKGVNGLTDNGFVSHGEHQDHGERSNGITDGERGKRITTESHGGRGERRERITAKKRERLN